MTIFDGCSLDFIVHDSASNSGNCFSPYIMNNYVSQVLFFNIMNHCGLQPDANNKRIYHECEDRIGNPS